MCTVVKNVMQAMPPQRKKDRERENGTIYSY